MYKRVCVPDPIREITGAEIKGWPIIISHGILYGSIAVHPKHNMNVTGKCEVHVARRSFDELTINMLAWPVLEAEIVKIQRAMAQGNS